MFHFHKNTTVQTKANSAASKFSFLHGVIQYTVSQKDVPPLACYNFDAHEWTLIFFGRNVTDKVGIQKTLYSTMPPQIYCASALPDKTQKHENHIFHSIGLCYTHNIMHLCTIFLKEKIDICDVFDSVQHL